jgi:hypothetical protein
MLLSGALIGAALLPPPLSIAQQAQAKHNVYVRE